MNFHIRRVAVLGAGVMGAQIATHLANAGLPVVLFDLAAKEGDPNGVVLKALDVLKKLEPSRCAFASDCLISMPPTTTRTWNNCWTAT